MTETQHVNLIHLEDANDFQRAVLESPVPVIVDLWAPWCGPCRVQGPILACLAEEKGDQLRIVKINVDDHPELAKRFQVRAVPTLLVFDGGDLKTRLVGVHSADELKKAADL